MFDNLAMSLISNNEEVSGNLTAQSQEANNDIGLYINDLAKKMEDPSAVAALRGDLFRSAEDALIAGIGSKKNFNFIGRDAPETYTATVLQDNAFTNELLAAQSAFEKYKVVDRAIDGIRHGLPRDEMLADIETMAKAMKSLSDTNPYMDLAAKSLGRQSREFSKAYEAAKVSAAWIKPPDYIHGRMERGTVTNALAKDKKIARTEYLDELIDGIYKNPSDAKLVAHKLLGDGILSSVDIQGKLAREPEHLGEIEPLRKGLLKRVDKKATNRSTSAVKSEMTNLKKRVEHEAKLFEDDIEIKVDSLSKGISAPSKALAKAHKNMSANQDIMKGQAKGVELDSILSENDSLMQKFRGTTSQVKGLTAHGLQRLNAIYQPTKIIQNTIKPASLKAAQAWGVTR